MRRLHTMIKYEDLLSIAERGGKARGHPLFLKLFKPALEEMADDLITALISSTCYYISIGLFGPPKILEAIHILIIQEYVKRVEKTEEEERIAAERLEKLREEVRKEEWYTSIKKTEGYEHTETVDIENLVTLKATANKFAQDSPDRQFYYVALNIWQQNLDNFKILQRSREALRKAPDSYTFEQVADDQYSSYSVSQFRDEIEYLGKRSFEALLEGDRAQAASFDRQASDLTQRMKDLEKKITYAKAYGFRTAYGAEAMRDQAASKIKGRHFDYFWMDDMLSENPVFSQIFKKKERKKDESK